MYQIRRRSYNITYQENRRNSSSASSEAQSSDEQITNESDTEKLNAELLKELKKKDVNNKAVAELQRLTFTARNEYIKSLSGEDVEKVLDKYPYMKEEQMVSTFPRLFLKTYKTWSLLGIFFTQKFQHEKFEKNTCK